MDKIIRIFAYYLVPLIIISCSDFDNEWKREEFEGEQFDRLVIVGLAHDLETRKIYEEAGVKALANESIEATMGVGYFPQYVTELNNSARASQIIEENEIDGVLMIKVLHENDHKYMMPEDYSRFHIYYGRWGKSVHMRAHGYYQKPDRYYIVATLYNLKENHHENEETVVWRASSSIANPSNNTARKVAFIERAVAHLIDRKVIKRTEE